MEQPGRHERSKGSPNSERGIRGRWRTGRPSRTVDAEAYHGSLGPAGPDPIESLVRERSLYDLFDGRDYTPEGDAES